MSFHRSDTTETFRVNIFCEIWVWIYTLQLMTFQLQKSRRPENPSFYNYPDIASTDLVFNTIDNCWQWQRPQQGNWHLILTQSCALPENITYFFKCFIKAIKSEVSQETWCWNFCLSSIHFLRIRHSVAYIW